MNEDLEKLADRLRRGREAIESALSDTMTGRTEELVKKINELRERVEKRINGEDGEDQLVRGEGFEPPASSV